MSHRKRLVTMSLALSCALSMAACSASDHLVGARPVAISDAVIVTRGGLDGLRQDLADIRALPPDVRMGSSMGESISRDELASGLEAQLRALSRTPAAPSSPTSLSAGTPQFDYLNPGDIGGHTSTYPSGRDSQGYRYESTYAYTSCNQWTGVVARVDPHGFFDYFATGTSIGPLLFFAQSNLNYVSSSAQQGIRTDGLVGVHVSTKHTCEIRDSTGNFAYKTTEAFTVI